MMHHTPSSVIVRLFAPVVVLVTLGCSGTPREPATTPPDATLDKRTAVALPFEGQQAVLHEMRQMLGAMGGAMATAVQGDTTALLAALLPAGSAAAADPAIEELLPAEWKELAERTHGAFDSLAVAARRARSPQALKDTVLVRLAQVSGSCTACHDTYRVTVK